MRALLAMLLVTACVQPEPTERRREFAPDMVDSVPYDAFDPNPHTRDGKTLMAPPAGSLARGTTRFEYGPGADEALRAGRELVNPFAATPVHVARGAKVFARVCTPCHGPEGMGDGKVIPKFPAPPSLAAAHARGLADGQLFHIITHGQGLMPSHRIQVRPDDRWKVVLFLRKLQGVEPELAAGGAP